MKFNGITKKGREYLAKIQAENKPINFSKIKIGDGRLDNYDNPAELEHLINQKVEKGILTLNQEQDTVILTTNIDNVSLRTGYYPREIGAFVNDNGQEIMYYYMNDGDETSWIPPETDGPFKIELKLNLIASNAQSIIVQGSGKELYITKEFLEANYTQNGGYTGTAQEIDDRLVSALGKEDGKFPLTEAIKGNVYYFPGNKKFYICKEAQNRRVSVPDGNFEELSIWENRKRLENLFKVENHNDISVLKFSNIAIVCGVFKNIEFNKSTDISIPVTFKSASISAIPWHTGTPGNLSIMAYINTNKVTIRVNNGNTGLQNASGTFIVVGIV
ncbi:phage tail protein [Fusobacterium animalis]|uniref:phage tail-collar fiber domain-containing protein n=1 Tax=Fusobacterium animalis TaxID=76859 RepID=UPI0030CB1C37